MGELSPVSDDVEYDDRSTGTEEPDHVAGGDPHRVARHIDRVFATGASGVLVLRYDGEVHGVVLVWR